MEETLKKQLEEIGFSETNENIYEKDIIIDSIHKKHQIRIRYNFNEPVRYISLINPPRELFIETDNPLIKTNPNMYSREIEEYKLIFFDMGFCFEEFKKYDKPINKFYKIIEYLEKELEGKLSN